MPDPNFPEKPHISLLYKITENYIIAFLVIFSKNNHFFTNK